MLPRGHLAFPTAADAGLGRLPWGLGRWCAAGKAVAMAMALRRALLLMFHSPSFHAKKSGKALDEAAWAATAYECAANHEDFVPSH